MNRNTRTLIVLLVAVAAAAGATLLVYQAIQRRPVQQVALPQAFVVVAARPLTTGASLTPADLKLVGWPAEAIVPGSFTKIEEVVDRGVIAALLENEPITESKLAAVGAGAGLPPTIPPGMRALSVRVNDVVGVAGFVTPGNRVDVFVTLKRNDTTITRVVTSNVQVLTAGTKYDQDKTKNNEPIPTAGGDAAADARGRREDRAGGHRGADHAGAAQPARPGADQDAGHADRVASTASPVPVSGVNTAARRRVASATGARPARSGTAAGTQAVHR